MWIVFDYGEVISTRTAALPTLAALLGVPVDALDAAYWAPRDAYDRGQADLDYWRAVGDGVGVSVSPELAAELTEVDIEGWLHPAPESLALLDELADLPLALLSNAPVSFARVAERQEWTKDFRHLVFSGDLGVAKPDPAIWEALARQLGAEPRDCVFFDDRQVNIDGALTAGMGGVLWRGAVPAREELVRLGVLGAR
ncbi:HAD-IA family hydrolase [Umezawaea tangerina]|uniref:Putative hydrolase of the HAD superfamily n=1 Tax=Umezawaea tangerina TaxID=84725 RepID=A0A2T0SGX8_9PSEU|nr:HAD-IA family hydrolase [Umezawaea tangerina]PRY32671.1 putative hydrolase of the HAD superfamily [Umezawaea tangerina]